jgi:hypothetical protein
MGIDTFLAPQEARIFGAARSAIEMIAIVLPFKNWC